MDDNAVTKGAVTLPVVSIKGDEQKNIDDFFANDPNDPMNNVKMEIRSRFELLPKELQTVIVDESYQTNLFAVAKNNKLTFEELGTLEIETTMVLLGMTKPENYRDEIQEQLKKNDPEIDALVSDVNEKIFAPIKIQLEKLYSGVKEPVDFLKENNPELVKKDEVPVTSTPTVTQTAPVRPITPSVAQTITQTTTTPAPGLTAEEKTVLKNTGVVLSETTPVVKPAPMTMPSRMDVLKGIENPPKAPSAGLVADKFNTATPSMPAQRMTDYSIPKPSAPSSISTPTTPAVATPKPGPDPYREPIN